MVRLLLVEDHHLVRRGMCALLDEIGAYEIVTEVHHYSEIISAIEHHSPDVVLLDLYLPDGNTLDLIQTIRHLPNQPRVLILSMQDDAYTVQMVLNHGADGFLSKRSVKQELQKAIDTVWTEGHFLCEHAKSALAAVNGNFAFGDPISSRELEVLELIIAGKTTREIAEELIISNKTVEKHRGHLMRKLGVQNMAELITTAHQRQLVQK